MKNLLQKSTPITLSLYYSKTIEIRFIKLYVSIGKVAKLFGVSVSAIRLWEKKHKLLPDFRTLGGHRRYKLHTILELIQKSKLNYQVQLDQQPGLLDTKSVNNEVTPKFKVVGYVRVSGNKQKKELQTQIDQIQQYADQQGWEITKIYRDIASGMNDQRKGLMQLLHDLPVRQPYALVTTYPDRLARFGNTILEVFCQVFSCDLVHIFEPKLVNKEQLLVDDVISLVTSFAGKLHRQRRGRQILNLS